MYLNGQILSPFATIALNCIMYYKNNNKEGKEDDCVINCKLNTHVSKIIIITLVNICDTLIQGNIMMY